ALALGRMGSENCEPLLSLLADEEPGVRAAAARGLARCPEAEVGALAEALEREQDTRVRHALLAALGTRGGDDAVPPLARELAGGETTARFAAAQALGRSGSKNALEPLLTALEDEAPEVRMAALNAFGELGD